MNKNNVKILLGSHHQLLGVFTAYQKYQ